MVRQGIYLKALYLFLCFLSAFFCFSQFWSQNLVYNSSFEQNSSCPDAFSTLNNTVSWSSVIHHSGTPDLFWKDCPYNGIGTDNVMAKNQFPKDGDAFVGVFAHGDNLREYFTGELSDVLQKGKAYNVSFWLRPAVGYGTVINSFGLHFSAHKVEGNGGLHCLKLTEHIGNPRERILSDTNQWVKIQGVYFAKGDERFITLGNFLPDHQTAFKVIKERCVRPDRSYMLVDQISVEAEELGDLFTEKLNIETPRPKYQLVEKYQAKNQKVNIQIWDHNKIDGDTISVLLNGKYIVKNQVLSHVFHTIELQLEEGSNVFEMQAMNLGSHPPNTAAIRIIDGANGKKMVLYSTLTRSQAIDLVWKPD